MGLSRNNSVIKELIEKKVVNSFSTCGDTSISALISIFIIEEATRLGKLSFPIKNDYRRNAEFLLRAKGPPFHRALVGIFRIAWRADGHFPF